MQAAKDAVREILKHDRKADTEVREIVNPAITKEKILQEERERKTIAIDKELHQDHYQTRIQPVIDKKILAEEHKHHIVPVEYREHHHNKKADIARLIEKERSEFKSTREVLPTVHTTESSNTVVGEHHHHHVYETVQPIIEREVIQPTVIHTTIPVHERIEKDPSFHPKTIQPTMTMEEFIRAGGNIEGREERRDIFEGEPQVMENGGADVTHPNAWTTSGHHVDSPGVTSMASRGEKSTSRGISSPHRTGSPVLSAEERARITGGGRTGGLSSYTTGSMVPGRQGTA